MGRFMSKDRALGLFLNIAVSERERATVGRKNLVLD